MEQTKVFKGGNLFDGTGADLIKDAVVVMKGSKFSAVGKNGQVKIPEGKDVEVIDTTGKTMIPGLIDSHIHLNLDGTAGSSAAFPTVQMNKMEMLVRSIPKLQNTLKMGYTSIRGGGDGWGWFEVAMRDGLERGDIQGPRFQATGYHLTVSGGHGTFLPYHVGRHRLEEMAGMYADGADEWKKLARLNIWNRVDNLKVVASWGFMDGIKNMHATFAQATVEELKAAVREAHAVNKKVLSHANGHEAVKNSIEAGVDIISHGFFLTDVKLLEAMAEKGIFWEPTNAAARNMFWAATDTFPKSFTDRHQNNLPRGPIQIGIENWEYRLKNFKRMVSETGVKVLMGSDGGCSWIDHGLNALELEASVDAGFSPKDALISATKLSAESLGINNEVGSVEVGKYADLVVVEGDLLANISLLLQEDKIKMVYKNGELVIAR